MTAVRKRAHEQLDLVPDEKIEQVLNFIVTFTDEDVSAPIKIGVGKDKFKAPEDFDANNEEAIALLKEYALS